MTDTKMLQMVLDGQVTIRKEIKEVREDISNLDKKLTKRIGKIGASVAFLEDDAPTRKEHNKLEKRVVKVEHQISSL